MEASYEEIFILLTRPNLSRTKLDKSDENSILLFWNQNFSTDAPTGKYREPSAAS